MTVRVIDVPAPGTALGETRFIQSPQPNRVNPDQNIGTPELRVARNIPDQNFGQPGQEVKFAIPADTFVHTDQAASVSLNAVMVDGQALPNWLVFDPAKGEFRGIPPEGFAGELVVKVMARDDNGRQAETIVRIRFGDRPAQTGSVGRPSLASQFDRHGVFAWKLERDRLIQQAKEIREEEQLKQVA